MPCTVSILPCPFCPHSGRQDNLNKHILAKHTLESVLDGGKEWTATQHPERPYIVVVKSVKDNKELCAYCFECYTRVRSKIIVKPSVAAKTHKCYTKKNSNPPPPIAAAAAPAPAPPSEPEAPVLEVADVSNDAASAVSAPTSSVSDPAPAAAPAPAPPPPPAPAPPKGKVDKHGVDWERIIRILMEDKRTEKLRRLYADECEWVKEEMEGDFSEFNWKGVLIDAITDGEAIRQFREQHRERMEALEGERNDYKRHTEYLEKELSEYRDKVRSVELSYKARMECIERDYKRALEKSKKRCEELWDDMYDHKAIIANLKGQPTPDYLPPPEEDSDSDSDDWDR